MELKNSKNEIITIPECILGFRDRIKLIFDDLGRATPKEGTYIGKDDHFLFIESDKGKEGVPFSRIIRVEILG
jgi:hypothetical protein